MTIFELFKRHTIIIMFVVLLIGSVAHFFIFRFFIHRSTNQVLHEYKQHIENYVQTHDTLIASSLSVLQPPRVETKLVENFTDIPYVGLKDTLLYSEATGEFTPYRQLYFTVSFKNYKYLVNINQPVIETDDLFYAIIASLIVLFILFLFFSYLLGKYVKNKLWQPFYKLLRIVVKYDLNKADKLQLESFGIKEFDELSHVINRMVEKIHADYINLKRFTEDVSHEMQTPLSVIQSQIDLLLQKDDNDIEKLKSIQIMSRATKRLSKFNRSLLLLAKINNNQFNEKQRLNLAHTVSTQLYDLEELLQAKGITVSAKCSDMWVTMNLLLSETMVSNLLINSIHHNTEGGKINIEITPYTLQIENTTSGALVDNNVDLFKRFEGNKRNKQSNGLGLSILKSICDISGLTVSYSYTNTMFTVIVKNQTPDCEA